MEKVKYAGEEACVREGTCVCERKWGVRKEMESEEVRGEET